jgi:hypothetical protein
MNTAIIIAGVPSAVTATHVWVVGIAALWLLAIVVVLALLYAFGERRQRPEPDAPVAGPVRADGGRPNRAADAAVDADGDGTAS